MVVLQAKVFFEQSCAKTSFYSDQNQVFLLVPFRGSSQKWKFCPFVHLFVCLSVITSHLTDITVSVAQIKKILKTRCIFFKFCFWEARPHPINWSPTHSGPLICFLLNFRACLYWFPICLSLLLTFLSFLGQVCNCDFKMLTGNAK